MCSVEEAPRRAGYYRSMLLKKYPNVSVGKINILMNIFVYLICLFLFNIEIVAYSFIYTTVLSMAIDRVHIQNINTSVMIFTKNLESRRQSWIRWDVE